VENKTDYAACFKMQYIALLPKYIKLILGGGGGSPPYANTSFATVLCSASLRSFLRVIYTWEVHDLLRLSTHEKTLSMRFCLFILQLTVV